MKTLIIIVTLLSALLAQAQQRRGVETLLGAQVYGNSVKIQVRSGGCTWKKSFAVKKVLSPSQKLTELTFVRVIPDFCEAYLPEGRFFTFTQNDLRMASNDKFCIGNPFYPNP
jgi:hypothetical protein